MSDWQIDEIRAGIEELDAGEGIPHEQVAAWLRSWGTRSEQPSPIDAQGLPSD